MLVLKRARGERIVIDGGRIVITLVECGASGARIGIDAPKEVIIHREEVQIRLDRGEPMRGGER